MIKKLSPFLFIVGLSIVLFWQVFLKGLLPIPTDTIVGLYHPYRDLYASSYPNGIPFKNFLITDPVRQTLPWRNLSFDSGKNFTPSWNPYSFSGTPGIANFQSAFFYPFNALFLVLPFTGAWTFLIILQPILAGIFMFLYLRNLKLDHASSILGSVIFSFCGFSTVWLEWGTILNTALWLPLILLSVDKLFQSSYPLRIKKYEFNHSWAWSIILFSSLLCSFFAGHLQTFFYIFVLAFIYFLFRWFGSKKELKSLKPFAIVLLGFFLLSSIQWVPTLQFIFLSSRGLDQNYLNSPGWFLPFQNTVQFLIPDFFGNPSTLNYWGTWNYGELTGYGGVIAIILSLYSLFYRRTKEVWFFAGVIILSLLLAFPEPFAKLPYIFNLPFISTAQPTRLLFLVDFSLAILAAFGLNALIKSNNLKKTLMPIILVVVLFGLAFLGLNLFKIDPVNFAISERNFIFPIVIFVVSAILIILITKFKNYSRYFLFILVLLTVFDLFRFSWKFNTFSKKEYLFPTTKTINFLKENSDGYRIATNDPRILPPNFPVIYHLSSVEGYDPLYLQRYAELISSINRNKPNTLPPFGFNRIVRIQNFDSPLVDLLGVKYVLSLTDIKNSKFIKVFEEGQTKVYENENVLPRAFVVQKISVSNDANQTIEKMFDPSFNPINEAVVEEAENKSFDAQGSVSIDKYDNDRVQITVEIDKPTYLVLTDTYYPTWKAKLDNKTLLKIYRTDYNFRGVFVPEGKHTVTFYNSLL